MNTRNLSTRIFFASILAVAGWISAAALPADYYTGESVLSAGKWIKVKVSESGVTEITETELKAFGFTNPDQVKIFGYGGTPLPTVLQSNLKDDLEQIPVMRKNDKLYFYAQSGNNMYLTGSTSSRPKFEAEINPYSKEGYYFLTDTDIIRRDMDRINNPNIGTETQTNSLGYVTHHMNLINPGSTGQIFLGEDFTGTGKIAVDFNIPARVDGTQILVNTAIAYNGTGSATMDTYLNGEEVPFLDSAKNLRPNSTMFEYYYYLNAYTYITPAKDAADFKVEINVTPREGNAKLIKLDYVTLTYTQQNTLANGENQRRLTFPNLNFTNAIEVTDTDNNIEVWNIVNRQNPFCYNLDIVQDEVSKIYTASFTPRTPSVNNLVFTAFNTSREQHKVTFVGEVSNQNLHGVAVPHMLIITPAAFMPYAQEIAQLHKTVDGLDVIAIEQEQIFNEFSSGTPDATAYRRFAKMLYDKDSEKFKYLLLFGTGSYDNSDVNNNRSKDRLLTYQSESGTIETDSYTTDDYFTYLADGKGAQIDFTKCDIAVGRMPVATVEEARSCVEKLAEFIKNRDFSSWKNSGLIFADEGDNDLHTFQAEGVKRLINDTLDINLHLHKIYMDDFPLDSKGTATEAKARIKELLGQGMLFATYIGHGGPTQLTKRVKLWELPDVDNTEFKNLPMFTLATCDVARFDSDTRGIAERMFHKRNGGAIACLASARTVYATENDMLNRAFIRALFTPINGQYPTIGDAVKASKNFFNKRSINKLSYFLFGDPAMRLIYPKHGIELKTVNETELASASITPMNKTVFSGEIAENGIIDPTFNGTVHISVYEGNRFFKNIMAEDGISIAPVYLSNVRYGVYSAEVVNGKFSVECILPKDCPNQANKAIVNIYAHNSETNAIVNSKGYEIAYVPYDETTALQDNVAPVITSMYVDTPEFSNGDIVCGNPVLFAEMSDETSLNMQTVSIGHSCTLVLDGKQNISGVAASIAPSDNGKKASLEIPIGTITPGKHTLELTVCDAAGNSVSRTVTFIYQPENPKFDINVAEYPARESATFTITGPEDTNVMEALVRVTDNNGNTLWSKNVYALQIQWDLKGNNGERVVPGAYFYYAQIKSDNGFASTPTKKIIVVKQ